MGLLRVVPGGWKSRFYSTMTLPLDTAVRVGNRLSGGIPIPPGEFIGLVSGHRSAARFLRRGRAANNAIRNILRHNGIVAERFDAILDFGCGVGRIMRHWDLPHRDVLHGTDYNPRLVDWCRVYLKVAEFQVNTLSDKLSYRSESFDFIYAFSVFTHLSESLQLFWMDELSRVLKPGGHLMFTTHGKFFFSRLREEERVNFQAGQLVVRAAEQSGSNMCATFHPKAYVQEVVARDFVMVDFISGSADTDLLQDIYLLRRLA